MLTLQPAAAAGEPALPTVAGVPVPGGARALAEAAGLTAPPNRSLLLLEVIRRLYHAPLDGPSRESVAAGERVRAAFAQAASDRPGEGVPLPLGTALWKRAILREDLADEALVPAILEQRKAALFYYGVSAMDAPSRSWLEADPERLSRLYLRHGELWSAFGRSIRIDAGRLVVPGGSGAEPVWEALVDASPASPEAFIDNLFERRGGRLAWFYDVVAHLPTPMQRHLTGAELRDPDKRLSRLRAAAEVFTRVAPDWRVRESPMWRPLVDPALLLSELAAGPDGRLAEPRAHRFWTDLFASESLPGVPDPAKVARVVARRSKHWRPPEMDAAFLLARVFLDAPPAQRDRFEQALFAQRVARVTGAPAAAPGDVDLLTICRGFSRFKALVLSFERMGLADAPVMAAALRRAARVTADEPTPSLTTFQALLALVERTRMVRTIDAHGASALVASLAGVPFGEERPAHELAAEWIASTLLPSVASPGPSAESRLLDALAGVSRIGSNTRREEIAVTWEGQRYVVDPAAAEQERLTRVRAAQRAPSLDEALQTATHTGRAGSEDAARGSGPADGRAFADALVAIVYAAHLPADRPELTAARADARHDLGLSAPQRQGLAWELAQPQSGSGGAWRLRGSLLSLDLAFGPYILRRISDEPPVPTLGGSDRQAFLINVALLNEFDLADEDRDLIVAAVSRGRERFDQLAREPAGVREIAARAGLSEWREHALAWSLAQESSPSDALSLVELFWLGVADPVGRGPDAWGASLIGSTGQWATRFPRPRAWEDVTGHWGSGLLASQVVELTIRTAQWLAEMRLPAALARGVLSVAVLEFVDRVPVGHPDDWPALVHYARVLPAARFEDYVAALTVDGPLRPASSNEELP